MACRGRLNILANILVNLLRRYLKSLKALNILMMNLMATKYHKGYSSEVIHNNKRVKMTLVPNPSHLEAVNAVAAGICKKN